MLLEWRSPTAGNGNDDGKYVDDEEKLHRIATSEGDVSFANHDCESMATPLKSLIEKDRPSTQQQDHNKDELLLNAPLMKQHTTSREPNKPSSSSSAGNDFLMSFKSISSKILHLQI